MAQITSPIDDDFDAEDFSERYHLAEKQLLMELVELAAIAGLPEYYDEYCALLRARCGTDSGAWRLH